MISLYNEIDVLIYAFIMLTILSVYILKNDLVKSYSSTIYIWIVLSIMLNIALEAITWIAYHYNTPFARGVNLVSTSLLISLSSVPVILWMGYSHNTIFKDNKKTNKYLRIATVPVILLFSFVSTNGIHGLAFTINENNEYIRGIVVYVLFFILLGFTLASFVMFRMNRKKVRNDMLVFFASFTIFPIIGSSIQVYHYGATLMWASFALATLTGFIVHEKESMRRDPLTNLVTRGQLEENINYKLKNKSSFVLTMVDVDDFKDINDTYGHNEGDEALIIISGLLENAVGCRDTVCRYGGDEFMLLVDTGDNRKISDIEGKIYEGLDAFNRAKEKPYTLSLSLGSKYFYRKLNLINALAEVDGIMYKNKREKKEKKGA